MRYFYFLHNYFMALQTYLALVDSDTPYGSMIYSVEWDAMAPISYNGVDLAV